MSIGYPDIKTYTDVFFGRAPPKLRELFWIPSQVPLKITILEFPVSRLLLLTVLVLQQHLGLHLLFGEI